MVHNRMTASFPAEANCAGPPGGNLQSARTTSVLPEMVLSSLPVVDQIRISLSAQPVATRQSDAVATHPLVPVRAY